MHEMHMNGNGHDNSMRYIFILFDCHYRRSLSMCFTTMPRCHGVCAKNSEFPMVTGIMYHGVWEYDTFFTRKCVFLFLLNIPCFSFSHSVNLCAPTATCKSSVAIWDTFFDLSAPTTHIFIIIIIIITIVSMYRCHFVASVNSK